MASATRASETDHVPKIGALLRRARRERNLTLEQVADATGLSKGFISLVERDRTSASFASLLKICAVLDIRMGSLFDPVRSNVVRSARRSGLELGGDQGRRAIIDYLLTPSSERSFQIAESCAGPGGTAGDELYSFEAESEFIYVLAGNIEFRLGSEAYRLETGDTLTFSPREPHTWRNISDDEDARVLFVISPPTW